MLVLCNEHRNLIFYWISKPIQKYQISGSRNKCWGGLVNKYLGFGICPWDMSSFQNTHFSKEYVNDDLRWVGANRSIFFPSADEMHSLFGTLPICVPYSNSQPRKASLPGLLLKRQSGLCRSLLNTWGASPNFLWRGFQPWSWHQNNL